MEAFRWHSKEVAAFIPVGLFDAAPCEGRCREVEHVDEVVADASRVTQILYNLLSNAIGFSEPNSVARLSCRSDGAMLALSVRDEGPGIPEDLQDTVFDRFESRTQGSRHRGAGLGLSIVKSLAELHGGTVSLESEPGLGSRFTVLLPLTQDLNTPDLNTGPVQAKRAV